jgi:hypothetical protein
MSELQIIKQHAIRGGKMAIERKMEGIISNGTCISSTIRFIIQ